MYMKKTLSISILLSCLLLTWSCNKKEEQDLPEPTKGTYDHVVNIVKIQWFEDGAKKQWLPVEFTRLFLRKHTMVSEDNSKVVDQFVVSTRLEQNLPDLPYCNGTWHVGEPMFYNVNHKTPGLVNYDWFLFKDYNWLNAVESNQKLDEDINCIVITFFAEDKAEPITYEFYIEH